jgi:hypothetical protein
MFNANSKLTMKIFCELLIRQACLIVIEYLTNVIASEFNIIWKRKMYVLSKYQLNYFHVIKKISKVFSSEYH